MLAAILCCGTMNVQAQEEQEFEVTEGDFNVVKQKGKTGSVTFDYDHARMGNLRTKTIDKHFVNGMTSNRRVKRCSSSAGTKRRVSVSN